MNRFTTTMGQLSGGVISRGTAGVGKDITYDGAGQRASVTTTTVVSGININHVETYSYTEDGYLTKVNIQNGTGYNLTRAIDIRDKMGRVLTHTEYLSNGSINPTTGTETLGTVEYNRYNVVYDADSKVIPDTTSTTTAPGSSPAPSVRDIGRPADQRRRDTITSCVSNPAHATDPDARGTRSNGRRRST